MSPKGTKQPNGNRVKSEDLGRKEEKTQRFRVEKEKQKVEGVTPVERTRRPKRGGREERWRVRDGGGGKEKKGERGEGPRKEEGGEDHTD